MRLPAGGKLNRKLLTDRAHSKIPFRRPKRLWTLWYRHRTCSPCRATSWADWQAFVRGQGEGGRWRSECGSAPRGRARTAPQALRLVHRSQPFSPCPRKSSFAAHAVGGSSRLCLVVGVSACGGQVSSGCADSRLSCLGAAASRSLAAALLVVGWAELNSQTSKRCDSSASSPALSTLPPLLPSGDCGVSSPGLLPRLCLFTNTRRPTRSLPSPLSPTDSFFFRKTSAFGLTSRRACHCPEPSTAPVALLSAIRVVLAYSVGIWRQSEHPSRTEAGSARERSVHSLGPGTALTAPTTNARYRLVHNR